MQLKIINMLELNGKMELISDSRLSFKPFLTFLRTQLQKKDFVKKDLFAFVLSKFESFDHIDADLDLDQLPRYKDLLDLLYVVLTNLTEDEQQIYWGLCVPMTPAMFYGSDLFFELLNDANMHDNECGLDAEDHEQFIQRKLEHFYAYILKRFYDIQFIKKTGLVRTVKDKQSGLVRHFSINLNTDFVEITTKSKLPDIGVEMMRNYAMADNALMQLQQLLPIGMFAFRGFTILTVTDVSQQYALDTIRNNIVKSQAYAGNHEFPEIVQALKELTGSNAIEFNILPLFRVNGKLAEDMKTYKRSILFSSAQKKLPQNACMAMIEKFVSNPELFYFNDLDEEGPSHQNSSKILQAEGLKAYTLYPVFYHKKLVGAIEAHTRQKGLINKKMLSLLESAADLLAQLIHNSLSALEAEIETVIKEKYTRLQPAVQWKFIEAAWNYLQNKKNATDQSNHGADEISFKNIYPLYGAVDIRNSTIERNAAMLKDNRIRFEVLLKVLHALKQKTGFGLLDEKIYAVKKWADNIRADEQGFNQEVKLNDFLENNITPFLLKLTDKRPELQAIAKDYFNAIEDENGIAHANSRQLERSMTIVILAINNYFDQLKDEIQQAYPCYFEKFRTDGVEYDIYIGQAISPDQPYSDIYLKNLRLMQLTSMAAVAKYTHALLPNLTNPVETTQLIFIHSQPIDILFRNDEKRFDVEGAYNIRYHIIKKRIDKVHLKDSAERLTQPNKIALVYFSDKEAEEYISYIKYLQADNVLNNDLEKLELEELSGVAGLKALRVGVNLEDPQEKKDD